MSAPSPTLVKQCGLKTRAYPETRPNLGMRPTRRAAVRRTLSRHLTRHVGSPSYIVPEAQSRIGEGSMGSSESAVARLLHISNDHRTKLSSNHAADSRLDLCGSCDNTNCTF